MDFLGGSVSKESACNAKDPDLIPGLGRSSGEGNGYPLQYSYLGNPTDRGVNGVAKSQTRLSNDSHTHTYTHTHTRTCTHRYTYTNTQCKIMKNPITI